MTEHNQDDAEQDVLNFIFTAIEIAKGESEKIRAIVRFCNSQNHLYDKIFKHAAEQLSLSLQTSKSNIKFNDMPVTTVSTSQIEKQLTEEVNSITTRSFAYLSFLNALVLTPIPCFMPTQLLITLLNLIGSSSLNLSQTSEGVILALLSPRNMNALGSLQVEGGKSLAAENIWDRIAYLTKNPAGLSHRVSGYRLWLRWLGMPSLHGISQELLQKDAYWDLIQAGILDGYSEQRKICLAILMRSLSLAEVSIDCAGMTFDPAEKTVYHNQYDTFCTLFEIVVINRYMHQVRSCQADFNTLMSSKVHESWIYVLVGASCSRLMQENVRKSVGKWVLEAPFTPSGTAAYQTMLLPPLVSWAIQGYLFTSSVSRKDGTATCEHGELLSHFIRKSVASCSRETLRRSMCVSILTCVMTHVSTIFPHSVVYILEGLIEGLDLHGPCLLDTDLAMAVRLTSITGLPEVVRDFVVLQVDKLCSVQHASVTTAFESIPGYGPLRRKRQLLSAPQGQHVLSGDQALKASQHQSKPGQSMLVALQKDLTESSCKCLRGPGLLAALRTLHSIFSDGNELDSTDDLQKMLEAIWTETEIQDYPRPVLIELPGVFLHSSCVHRCSDAPQFAEFLSTVISELQHLSGGRIYAFAPLAIALRRAYFQESGARENLPYKEFVCRFASHPPTALPQFLLERAAAVKLSSIAPDRSYFTYYGHDEAIGHACVIDLLNRLRSSDVHLAQQSLDEILIPWLAQTIQEPVPYKSKKTLQLQVVIVLTEVCIQHATDCYLESLRKSLTALLAVEILPRYRVLLEWAITRLYIRLSGHQGELLSILSTYDHANPKFLASFVKIAVMIAIQPGSSKEYALGVMLRLTLMVASPKTTLRHEAQLIFPLLFEHAVSRDWAEITANPAFSTLDAHIRSLERYITPRADSRKLEWIEISEHNLRTLFEGGHLQINPSEVGLIRGSDFETVHEMDSRDASHVDMPSPRIPLGEPIGQHLVPDVDQIKAGPALNGTKSDNGVDDTAPLQTKGGGWQETYVVQDSLLRHCSDVVVVATLVDNAYNQGGISRVSEVFGAKSLHVRSLDVLKSKDFTSVAVSSEQHLLIHELKLDSITEFIRQRKVDGYTVVGLEQTDRSFLLGEEGTHLPKKMVLILGAERKGIPADILLDLDLCVEIKQVGVIRSLNVHTAAAVVLYEYARQHST